MFYSYIFEKVRKLMLHPSIVLIFLSKESDEKEEREKKDDVPCIRTPD